MTLMGDKALELALSNGDIKIDPAPEAIKAASIDMRLGPEAFLGTGTEIIDLEQRRLLTIPPGEMALVNTLEKIQIGPSYAGAIGLRSFYARKGIDLLAGPQIDPGFRGRLHVALVNLSPVEVSIAYREPMITVIFHDLGSPVDHPYGSTLGDEYAEQDELTGTEIDDIRQHRGYAMSEVIREMAALSSNVGELRNSVDGYIKTSDKVMRRSETYLQIFLAAVLTLIGVIAAYGIAHI